MKLLFLKYDKVLLYLMLESDEKSHANLSINKFIAKIYCKKFFKEKHDYTVKNSYFFLVSTKLMKRM